MREENLSFKIQLHDLGTKFRSKNISLINHIKALTTGQKIPRGINRPSADRCIEPRPVMVINT